MKTRAPAIAAAAILIVLAVIGMSCSRGEAPTKSTFMAEVGVWGWLQSIGGLQADTMRIEDVTLRRVLAFNNQSMVEFYEWHEGESVFEPDLRIGYTIDWEEIEGEQTRVLHYEGDVFSPQAVEFIGRDTLVLTDMLLDGYQHTYFRF